MIAPPLLKHTCNAESCRRLILVKFLMCYEHWAMVPPSLQKDVWRTWHEGLRRNQIHPTLEYAIAVAAAVRAVTEAEGRKAVQLELC
ncbi:MAG TPA: hypothetical protein VHY84_14820 [Bryobacteraceae bacterium]|jgi:hypothetical protein|nr:hypothetical protein [Bryobacteraceae bacterium]